MYRYDPSRSHFGDNPFQLDQKALPTPMNKFTGLENRFATLHRSLPDVAKQLSTELQDWASKRHETYKWRESRGVEAGAGTEVTLLVGTDTGTALALSLFSRLRVGIRAQRQTRPGTHEAGTNATLFRGPTLVGESLLYSCAVLGCHRRLHAIFRG